MPCRTIRWLSWMLAPSLLLVAGALRAQTQVHFPILRAVYPVALQVGTTAELEIAASNDLRGASQVIVTGQGVQGEIVPPAPPAEAKPGEPPPPLLKMKVRFTAAADALPGPRQLRLLAPRGASTLAEIVVVRDPVVVEAAENNLLAKAQPLAGLPATVCGQLEAKEDIDYFRFTVASPQSLLFHVWAQRLQHSLNDLRGRRFIDPILTLRTAAGATLATNDNFLYDDPLLAYHFTAPGDYVLEIRDVRYHGWGDYWPYAIEIISRPLVTQAFPPCVSPGVETRLSLVGLNLPADPSVLLSLSGEEAAFRRVGDRAAWCDGVQLVSPAVGGGPANAFPLLVSRFPVSLEADDDNNSPATAQPLALPTAIAGRIDAPGDVDFYRFEAKKDELFSFECLARRVGSPIDSALRIFDDKGTVLVESDDRKYSLFTMADSELDAWKAPADGVYCVEIRDVAADGGPPFVYALYVSRSQPRFLLEVNCDRTPLAPGIASPIFVRAERRGGFTGEVQLGIDGLPPGVTAECGRILPNGNDGCIILRAAPLAAGAVPTAIATNVRISGHGQVAQADGSMAPLEVIARPLQEIQQDGGGRGLVPVLMHTVSVTEPMEIRGLKLSAVAITLKPGESQKVEIVVERAADYKGNISLDALFMHFTNFGDSLPKGVTIDPAASKTILTGEETVGHIAFKAAADAPVAAEQLVPVMANVTVNFSTRLAFCEPLRITVAP